MTTTPPPDSAAEDAIDEILTKHRIATWSSGWNNDATEKAKQALLALILEARIQEVENLLSYAREHTITDIEMVMRHSGNTVDFIEGVDTRHFEDRLAQLKAQDDPGDDYALTGDFRP